MVEEDDLDDDGILIVFEDDIKRKESALVDSSFLERNPALSEHDKENGHLNEGIVESSKSLPLENLFSLECLIQMETEEKKLQEKEHENEWRRFEEMNGGENEKDMGEGMEEDNKIKVQPASPLFEEEYEEIKAQPPSSLSKEVIKREMIEEEDYVIKTEFGMFDTFLMVNDVELDETYASVLRTNDVSMMCLAMANNMNLAFSTLNNN